jgi:hypothetical protein
MVSSIGLIKELNQLQSYKDQNIKNEMTILIINENSLNFSEINKGNQIYLEKKNKVAFKLGGDEHQFAITEQSYSTGKHYFEVFLETEPYERSLIIGVTTSRSEYNFNPSVVKGFYGYVLSECKKVSSTPSGKSELIEYGDITKMGDRVGVMLEFTSSGLDISFYINKINMGVAFKNLPYNIYYPAVVLGFDGTRCLISNKMIYPDL